MASWAGCHGPLPRGPLGHEDGEESHHSIGASSPKKEGDGNRARVTENSEIPEEKSIRAPRIRVHALPGRPQLDDAFVGGLFGRYP